MTHRVGPKGQVVIPKEIRDALGLVPGDSVAFRLVGDGVRVTRVDLLETLRGRFRGGRLAEELAIEHRRELEKEERRAAEPGA